MLQITRIAQFIAESGPAITVFKHGHGRTAEFAFYDRTPSSAENTTQSITDMCQRRDNWRIRAVSENPNEWIAERIGEQ
jgi:hypothetical protein